MTPSGLSDRITVAVAGSIAAGDTDPFYETKVVLGRYYLQRILPDAHAHLAKLTSGSELTMALPAEAF